MRERAARVAFAAVVAAALGFGAVEVTAQPAAPTPGSARACSDATCARVCTALGFHGGFCNTGGGCSCYL